MSSTLILRVLYFYASVDFLIRFSLQGFTNKIKSDIIYPLHNFKQTEYGNYLLYKGLLYPFAFVRNEFDKNANSTWRMQKIFLVCLKLCSNNRSLHFLCTLLLGVHFFYFKGGRMDYDIWINKAILKQIIKRRKNKFR